MADVALVDIGALDLDAGQCLGLGEDAGQGVTIIRPALEGLGVEYELTAGGSGVGGGDRDLAAELVGLVCLAFGDALDLRGVQAVELPATLALLLGADLGGPAQGEGKDLPRGVGAGDLAPDVALQPAQAGAQELELPALALPPPRPAGLTRASC